MTLSKLTLLREIMIKTSLDMFIQPREDEHLSEYVPKASERLEWLTGFTGSAGWVIVTLDKAALFVDGRYTLQAIKELDMEIYSTYPFTLKSVEDWICKNINKKQTIGIDKRLISHKIFSRINKFCKNINSNLIDCNKNPIDNIWLSDRPPYPNKKCYIHSTKFSGIHHNEKRKIIAKMIQKESLDCIIIIDPTSISWLLNIRGSDLEYTPVPLVKAVIHANTKVDLFVNLDQLSSQVIKHLGKKVRIHNPKSFENYISKLGIEKKVVGIDPNTISAIVSDILNVKGSNVVELEDFIEQTKAKKNITEIKGMRSAHIRDGLAVCKFIAWFDQNSCNKITELDAIEKIDNLRLENKNFISLSFPTIGASGPNAAIIHYRANKYTNRNIKNNSLFLLDSGGQYLDGTTDITRTLSVGSPSKEMQKNYTLVLKGHIALANAKFPDGTIGSQLDAIARYPLWQHQLDFDHGTGHGVGHCLNVHEGPQRISKGSTIPLEEGMIVSNEPGYYKKNAYGIRIESLILVKKNKKIKYGCSQNFTFETLTLVPFDKNLIVLDILDEHEIMWINNYHQSILKILGPLSDINTKKWLLHSCSKLEKKK